MNETDGLKISVNIFGREKRSAVLTLTGYIDSATAPLLKNRLVILGKDINRFILDFGGVKYIASAGWGVILGRIKENREKGGDIIFANMIKEVHSIYELLDLNKVTRYYADTNDAAQHFGEVLPAPVAGKPGAEPPKEKPWGPVRKPTIEEAIRTIVSNSPLSNATQLKQILQGPPYGFSGLNTWKVYSLLRRLGLNTREKRLYHAWQYEKRKRKE